MKRTLFFVTLAGIGWWLWQRKRTYANQVPIKNKVVIITGATSGIGRAAACTFAAQGAHTVLVAQRANRLAEVQQELAPFDTKVLTIAANLTQDDDIQSVVDETLREFGRIDVLVNHAGITIAGPMNELDPADIHKMIELNLYATIRLTQCVLPTMIAQHSGHIVNVSSSDTLLQVPGHMTYAATKSGVNAFSTGLRREIGGEGVHISILMPGWAETPVMEHIDDNLINKIGMNLIETQTPQYVASHIVAAVRYRKKRVVLGGTGHTISDFVERIAPGLSDWLFKILFDKEQWLELMKEI